MEAAPHAVTADAPQLSRRLSPVQETCNVSIGVAVIWVATEAAGY
jgi:hypothetical protein